jgi:hypothetical protein
MPAGPQRCRDLCGQKSSGTLVDLEQARTVRIFKPPDSNIEAGHQGVLDSGRAGEP